MKRIAFFVQWMLCGGVENALIALSNKLIENGNDVTIYMIKEKGEFIKKIHHEVRSKKIPMPEKLRNSIPVGGTKVAVRECFEKKEYLRAAKFLVKHKMNKYSFAEMNVNLEKIPRLVEKYDIAVNFHMHSPFLVWYLSERVNADVKLTWIHNDFETTKYNIRLLKQYLECIDAFYGVSNKLVQEFAAIFPEYQNRAQVALNIVPVNEIISKAGECYPEEFEKVSTQKLKILTVGRLEEQKGYDIAVQVCKKLVEQNLAIEWFVLGDGSLRGELEGEIRKFKLKDSFHLLGIRMNPYPYFKYCDIYVQTSKHEGYVTTVTEAKIFSRPIVCTDVSGAREQLVDGVSGDIADIDASGVLRKLERLIKEPGRREKYSQKLREEVIAENPEWFSIFG